MCPVNRKQTPGSPTNVSTMEITHFLHGGEKKAQGLARKKSPADFRFVIYAVVDKIAFQL